MSAKVEQNTVANAWINLIRNTCRNKFARRKILHITSGEKNFTTYNKMKEFH